MKVLNLLVLVPIVAALFCRPSAAQSNGPPGDSALAAGGWRVLMDERERTFQPTFDFPGLDQRAVGEYDRDAISTLVEMRRLFAVPAGDDEVEVERVVGKMLVVAPLLGRSNGLQLFITPQHDIYVTIVERIALRELLKAPQLKPLQGTIAVDTHVHTCFSPDSVADVSQMLQAAANRGLSGVAITDHNTLEGALEAQKIAGKLIRRHKLPDSFFVIPGEEISSSDGHIVGLFLSQRIPAGMSAKDTIEAIHAQGGIAIAAHPLLPHSLGKLSNTEPFDAVETLNGAEELHYASAERKSKAARSAFYAAVTKPRIGSSDAHDPEGVAQFYTLLNCAPTPDAVRMAIVAGRTTPCRSISDEGEGPMRGRVIPGLLGLGEKVKHLTDLSDWLGRVTGADDVVFTPLPRPTLLWAKRF
jgi:predicted metal-dependent phosphoesterase TrpH